MNLKHRPWQVGKLIQVAQHLKKGKADNASFTEKIAAAFVLDDQLKLPEDLRMAHAWAYLSLEWQAYVLDILQNYMNEIEEE